MEFIPFSAPASDHDPFHTGLSAEKGVTPKNFVEGVNAYFTHIFQVLKGDITHAVEVVDDDARTALLSLAEHVTSLEKKMEAAQAEIFALQNVNPASPQPPQPGVSMLEAAGIVSSFDQITPQAGIASSVLQAALNKATGQ